MRNISSPEESVAPTILSGSSPLSNPLSLSPFLDFFSFFKSDLSAFLLSPAFEVFTSFLIKCNMNYL